MIKSSQCGIQLQGKKNFTLQLKAICPTSGVSGGLKAIVPFISDLIPVWNADISFPKIWVSA